ncbi:MAG: S26 family signal peptidase [Planctomycetota bacterium]|nr:MAG: S26 family signal peptidase [Planctomycetota bacterium]REJ95120.1 MAG: S26 family signal peptidase [Planctomycetota bacterium]
MARRFTWRRIFEGLLLAVVLIVIVRTWLIAGILLPQRVAGPSMAEAFLGPHRPVTCRDCGWQFACAESLLPERFTARCPLCGERENDVAKIAPVAGTRLLLDRATFSYRAPRRWEPIVFRCAEQPAQSYLKRVVGLPGEVVELRRGDVYVNGQIERKSLAVARTMGILIDDTRYRPASGRLPARWRGEVEPGGGKPGTASDGSGSTKTPSRWQYVDGRFVLEAVETPDAPKVEVEPNAAATTHPIDWLTYRHRRREDDPLAASTAVNDDYATNQNVSRQLEAVDDVVAAVRLTTTGTGALFLAVERAEGRFVFRLERSGGSLTRDGEELNRRMAIKGPLTALGENRSLTLEWGSLDRRLLVRLNGRLILEHNIDATATTATEPSRPSLAIGGRSLGIAVESAKVWRDVHYLRSPVGVPSAAVPRQHTTAADAYFVLGDNSPVSQDSRVEPPGGVAAQRILGRPLFGASRRGGSRMP